MEPSASPCTRKSYTENLRIDFGQKPFEFLVLQIKDSNELFDAPISSLTSDASITDQKTEDEMEASETGKMVYRTKDNGKRVDATFIVIRGLLRTGAPIVLHVDDVWPMFYIELPEPKSTIDEPNEHAGLIGGKPWTKMQMGHIVSAIQTLMTKSKSIPAKT